MATDYLALKLADLGAALAGEGVGLGQGRRPKPTPQSISRLSCRRRIYRSHHLRRQRRYLAVGRVGFAAGARGYCDKYGKPKNLYRPSHVIALANWFVSADP